MENAHCRLLALVSA